jgi:hypothetical protein
MTGKTICFKNSVFALEKSWGFFDMKGEHMKIQKTIMILVFLPLFLSVGYADDNVRAISSVSSSDSKDADMDLNFDFENYEPTAKELKEEADSLKELQIRHAN